MRSAARWPAGRHPRYRPEMRGETMMVNRRVTPGPERHHEHRSSIVNTGAL
jgi:hypothetical protein